jgi:hypothetical protein
MLRFYSDPHPHSVQQAECQTHRLINLLKMLVSSERIEKFPLAVKVFACAVSIKSHPADKAWACAQRFAVFPDREPSGYEVIAPVMKTAAVGMGIAGCMSNRKKYSDVAWKKAYTGIEIKGFLGSKSS